jgi:lantibiotic modifying enzyme
MEHSFEDELEYTEMMVSFKVVSDELLRRTTYLIEVATDALEESNWPMFVGACAGMQDINEGILEITKSAGMLLDEIIKSLDGYDVEDLTQAAIAATYQNGYRTSQEAKTVHELALQKLRSDEL